MCFFPRYLPRSTPSGYPSYYKCGVCPECLSSRANEWALRAVMESRYHVSSCMITLTYDHYKYNSSGRIVGEMPVDSSLVVLKKDVQDFIKRLRANNGSENYYYSLDSDFKYMCSAEYGSKTHRAHYHLILFGCHFNDLVKYKKSKRGNLIYKSDSLSRVWQHGICTVDSVRIGASVARYCTKYMNKQYGANGTFSLFSQRIGLRGLFDNFNGRFYMLEGKMIPVPRIFWRYYTVGKFPFLAYAMKNSYPSVTAENLCNGVSRRAMKRRAMYRYYRDSLPEYQNYRFFWEWRSRLFEASQPSLIDRIEALNPQKFFNYKIALRDYYYRYFYRHNDTHGCFVPPPPRSSERVYAARLAKYQMHLPFPPRLITAGDRKKAVLVFDDETLLNPFDTPYKFRKKNKIFLLKPLDKDYDFWYNDLNELSEV